MWVNITLRWLKICTFGLCFISQNKEPQEIQCSIETANRTYFSVLQLILRPDISWGVPVIRLPLFGITVLQLSGTCSTYGGVERCIQSFGGKPEGNRHLEVLGVDGRIILKLFLKK